MPQTRTRPLTYQYRLEFWKKEGQRIQEVPLKEGDFSRAMECTFFEALRRGLFNEYNPPQEGVLLEPTFGKNKDDSPHTSGFTVVLPTPSGEEYRKEFTSNFFRTQAQRVMADLMVKGEVEADTILFQLAAYLDDEQAPEPGSGMLLEADEPLAPIRPCARTELGRTVAWDEHNPEDLPVLIPRHVLEEAVEEARQAPEREVGGFLLGHLRRDTMNGELFLEVTCHVPAENTEATITSVTFTPETWERAREVIQWRGEREIFVGWVHSHPFRFCAECPITPPPECVAKVLFYSSEDHFLMELTFPQPFMVGLQTAVEPKLEKVLGHLPVRLYGWRNGEIVPRGFEVIEE